MITFQFAKFIVSNLFRLKDFCEMSFIVTMVCTRQDISAKNLKKLKASKKKVLAFFITASGIIDQSGIVLGNEKHY